MRFFLLFHSSTSYARTQTIVLPHNRGKGQAVAGSPTILGRILLSTLDVTCSCKVALVYISRRQ